MRGKRISAFWAACLLLCGNQVGSAEDGAAPGLSELAKDKTSGSLFKFEKEGRASLLQLKGSAIDRRQTGDDTGSFGLEALYGNLFGPAGDQFAGYYFLSGKVESNNRQRFNATFGYFPPEIGGEGKVTYRLLHADIIDTLPLSGEFEEGALEQALGVTYRKRLNLVLKEITLKYAYTHLGGESVRKGPYTIDTPALWRQVRAEAGFGDIDTHDALVEFAAGADGLDYPVLEGIRLDLGGGYQHVNYGGFGIVPEFTDEGFTGVAELKACTPFGVVKGWYEDSQAATTSYGGYQIGGLDVYYKNIDYQYGGDEEIIGMAFTVDLYDTAAAFDRRCRPFFHPSDTGYTSVRQMAHISRLAADEFLAKPRVTEVPVDLYWVDRTSLPPDVQIDSSGEGPGLIVTTRCSQSGIRSVVPAGAGTSVEVNGNTIWIGLAGLPAADQTIVVQTNDNCCGYTEIMVRTRVGSLAVDEVSTRQGIGCQAYQPAPDPDPVPGTTPSVQPRPLKPNGANCTRNAQCIAGVCGSSTGTCGGDAGDACTSDSQCKTTCDMAYNTCF
jgi:hypothetical protein